RRHRRPARLLPKRRQGRAGDAERSPDAVSARPARGRSRRASRRPEGPEHRRIQATAATGQGPAGPLPGGKTPELRDRRDDREDRSAGDRGNRRSNSPKGLWLPNTRPRDRPERNISEQVTVLRPQNRVLSMTLSRRRFLRSAGVSLALPWLDAFSR